MTQTNVPGTDRGPVPAVHRIRVRLLVSYVVMIGQPIFLQPYAAARAALPALRRRTEALAQADPQRRREAAVLERRTQTWEAWAQQLAPRRKGEGGRRKWRARSSAFPLPPSASQVAQQLAGKTLFDAYRAAADRLSEHLDVLRRHDLQQGLGALIAWQTLRAVVQPLRYLGQAAEAIGRGALSQPVTVRAARGDVLLTTEALEEAKLHINMSVVSDGVEALDFLYRRGPYAEVPRPDLMLLDLNMPRKDGREVLAEIKDDPDLRGMPVVALTTSHAEQDILRTYNLHANAYVTKPVDLEQFIAIVHAINQFWLTIVTLPPSDGPT